MPSKTPKQAKAMKIAAAGKSSIGIPKSVGKEFVKADRIGKAGGRKTSGKAKSTPGGLKGGRQG